jgi:transcriptional regulator with XRE-family HTH domain
MHLPNPSLGKLLKEYRERKGMALIELAEKIDSTMQYVCDVESGRRPLRPERIEVWALGLGIDSIIIKGYVVADFVNQLSKRSGGVPFECQIIPKGSRSPQKQTGGATSQAAR